jgi:hypothetical protein
MTNEETTVAPTRCYVRYLGTRACFTNQHGGFLIVDRDELSDGERAVCERGGGYVILSDFVFGLIRWS